MLFLLLAATAANGLLAGASLDQSIKQLPARNRMGVLAFARYSQAADLANGVPWYATLGIGTAVLSLVAAITALTQHPSRSATVALVALIVLTLAHTVTTVRAAPTNYAQRAAGDNEQALTAIFDRFARWQTARAVLQVSALVAALAAVATSPGT
jgi:uncharacterized membrane protein